jgi:hypothetical protein
LGGYSHARFEKVVSHFPAEARGVVLSSKACLTLHGKC